MRKYLFFILFFSSLGFAQTGLTSKQISAKVESLKAQFYRNPSLENLTATAEAMSKIKNGTTFIAKNPNDPVSLRFKEFHLNLLEIIRANAKLSSCTKGTSILQRKVNRLMDGVSRMNKGGANAACDLHANEKKQALDDLDVYSALVEQHVQGVKPEQNSLLSKFATDEKFVRQSVYAQDPYRFSDNLRPGSPVFYQDARYRKLVADEHSKQLEEKVQKTMLVNGKDGREVGTETEDFINKKYGFDQDRSKELHLALMEGNRVNCLRNYLYYTQRFSFGDASDKITSADPYRDVESRANDLFGRYKTYGGYSTLPEYAIGSGDKNDIVNIGVRELKNYQKQYPGHARLSEDDVLQMLKPAIDEAVKTNRQADEVRNTKVTSLDNAADQNRARQTKLSAEYGIRSSALNRAFEKVRSSEVGFVVFTKSFQSNISRMGSMTPDEQRKMIRDAVKENIENTRKYANWISANQGTTDFFNRSKGKYDYDKTAEMFLYSSPSVIQDAIGKNPKLMGSLCGALKGAAKNRSTETPDWVIWGGGAMMLVGGPVAPIAGTAFGLTSTLVLNADHAKKAETLTQQKEFTGLGEYVAAKDWDEIRADKKELGEQIKKHEDAIADNWVYLAAGELGGRGLGKMIQSGTRVSSASKAIARESGVPETVRKAMVKEIKETTSAAEQLLGRQLTQSEMKALYQAHILENSKLMEKTRILRGIGFTDNEAAALLRNGVAGRKPAAATAGLNADEFAKKIESGQIKMERVGLSAVSEAKDGNTTYMVRQHDGPMPTRAASIRDHGFDISTRPVRDVKMAELNKELGFDLVPETKMTTLNGELVSMQKKVSGIGFNNDHEFGEFIGRQLSGKPAAQAKVKKQLEEMATLDMIGGNMDRNGSNLIYHPTTGKIYAIDNAEAFPMLDKMPGKTWFWEEGFRLDKPLEASTRKTILNLDENALAAKLGADGKLEPEVLAQMKNRIRVMKEVLHENPNASIEQISKKLDEKLVLSAYQEKKIVASQAEQSLGRTLEKTEKEGLYRAHLTGRGEEGKVPGTFAAKENYTEQQLRDKTRILRDAGFKDDEATKLIRDGIAGDASSFSSKEVAQQIEKGDLTMTRVKGQSVSKVEGKAGEPGYYVRHNYFEDVSKDWSVERSGFDISTRQKRDVKMYQLNKELGMDYVPEVKMGKLYGREVSIQKEAAGIQFKSDEALERYLNRELKNKPAVQTQVKKQFEDMALFDMVGGNMDRNSGNILFDPKTNKIVLIDHTDSFPVVKEGPGMAWFWRGNAGYRLDEPLEASTRKAILKLDENALAQKLGKDGVLEPEALEQMKRRVRLMKEMVNQDPNISMKQLAGSLDQKVTSYGGSFPGKKMAEFEKIEIQLTADKAKTALNRDLTPTEQNALYEAHIYGHGKEGKVPGTPAGLNNYTPAQLKKKTEILRKAGFKDEEAQVLLRKGIAGESATAESIPILVTRDAEKRLKKLPSDVNQRFQRWQNEIEEHGLSKVRERSGYHDELLFRCPDYAYHSVRLGLKYRIIYTVPLRGDTKQVKIIDFNDHQKSNYGKEYGCH